MNRSVVLETVSKREGEAPAEPSYLIPDRTAQQELRPPIRHEFWILKPVGRLKNEDL